MRSRHRATWALLGLALGPTAVPLASPAAIIVYNDGATHTVSDSSLEGNTIQVFDSASVQTTTLQLVDGGSLTRDPVYDWAVQLIPGFGRARLEMLGGFIGWKVQVASGGCVEMSGGKVTDLGGLNAVAAIWIDGPSAPAFAEISGSAEMWGVELRRNGYLRIIGGTILDLPSAGDFSLKVDGTPSSRASLTMTGGTVEGLFAHDAGLFFDGGTVEGEVFGSDGSFVDIASGNVTKGLRCGGLCKARVSGGTIGPSALSGEDSISIDRNASVTVSGGSVPGNVRIDSGELKLTGGAITGAVRLNQFAFSGPSKLTVTGGSVDQGITVSGVGSVRISGGSIGSSATYSVAVDGAPVEIFGGSFGAPMLAVGGSGFIRFIGTGLTLAGGQVMGTLADGTPINLAVSSTLNGQIVIQNGFTQQVSNGFWPVLKLRRARLKLPAGLRPVATDCNSVPHPTIAVEFDEIPNGDFIIEGMEIATNPGDVPYQDTIPIEIRQFGLQSMEPVMLASGAEQTLYYTLQTERGVSAADPPPGPVSGGTATFDFAMQSFTLEVELFYDIRGGAEDGAILFSGSDSLMTTEPAPWSPVDASGLLAAGPDDPFSPGEAAGAFFSIELEGSEFDLAVGQPEPAVALPVLGWLGQAVLTLLVAVVGLARAYRTRRVPMLGLATNRSRGADHHPGYESH